jgi:hypothetical protein
MISTSILLPLAPITPKNKQIKTHPFPPKREDLLLFWDGIALCPQAGALAGGAIRVVLEIDLQLVPGAWARAGVPVRGVRLQPASTLRGDVRAAVAREPRGARARAVARAGGFLSHLRRLWARGARGRIPLRRVRLRRTRHMCACTPIPFALRPRPRPLGPRARASRGQ